MNKSLATLLLSSVFTVNSAAADENSSNVSISYLNGNTIINSLSANPNTIDVDRLSVYGVSEVGNTVENGYGKFVSVEKNLLVNCDATFVASAGSKKQVDIIEGVSSACGHLDAAMP